MKRRLYILSVSWLVLMVSPSFSQNWRLGNFQFADEQFSEQITENIKLGFLPQSLEVFGDSNFTMHFQEINEEITDWVLYYFDNLNDLNTEFSNLLTQGWYPRDIAFDQSGLWSIFTKGSEPIVKSWRIISIPYDFKGETEAKMEEFISELTKHAGQQLLEDRLLSGISYWNGSITVLFLEHGETKKLNDFGFIVYANDGESMALELGTEIERGGLIEGFLVTPEFLLIPMYY